MNNFPVSFAVARSLLNTCRAVGDQRKMTLNPKDIDSEVLLATGAKLFRIALKKRSRYYVLGYAHNGQDIVPLGIKPWDRCSSGTNKMQAERYKLP